MTFFNKKLERIYKYIYIHDGETLLLKNIAEETGTSRPTVNKYLRWLERRELIKRTGKFFEIIPT